MQKKNTVVIVGGPKPPRRRRTNAQIEADAAQARLDALIAEAGRLAAARVEAATPAQKRRATIIINKVLRTGEGIRPKGQSGKARPK